MESPTHGSASITIHTLGRFEVFLSGVPLRFNGKIPHKPLDLLKGLLGSAGRGIARHVLCDALWPDLECWAARQALNTAVFRLRRILGCKRAVRVNGEQLLLDSNYCRVDAWDFESELFHIGNPETLLRALRRYRGSFLADTEHPLAFDARERLRRKFVRGILQLGDAYARSEDLDAAIDLLHFALDVEGTSEEVHRALIGYLGRAGHFAAMEAAYRRCHAVLNHHFGSAPSQATNRVYRDGRREPSLPPGPQEFLQLLRS
jgi:LuxR family transcriptional regulator, maltose regulon positive regulatory protein